MCTKLQRRKRQCVCRACCTSHAVLYTAVYTYLLPPPPLLLSYRCPPPVRTKMTCAWASASCGVSAGWCARGGGGYVCAPGELKPLTLSALVVLLPAASVVIALATTLAPPVAPTTALQQETRGRSRTRARAQIAAGPRPSALRSAPLLHCLETHAEGCCRRQEARRPRVRALSQTLFGSTGARTWLLYPPPPPPPHPRPPPVREQASASVWCRVPTHSRA